MNTKRPSARLVITGLILATALCGGAAAYANVAASTSSNADVSSTFSNNEGVLILDAAADGEPIVFTGTVTNESEVPASISLSALAQDLTNLEDDELDSTLVTISSPSLDVDDVTVTLREFAWGAGMELEMSPDAGWQINAGESADYTVSVTPTTAHEEPLHISIVLTSLVLDAGEGE